MCCIKKKKRVLLKETAQHMLSSLLVITALYPSIDCTETTDWLEFIMFIVLVKFVFACILMLWCCRKIETVADRDDVDLKRYFQEGFDFINEAKRNGGAVLVHCYAGRSRR